jgi:hypothetical protein
LEVEVSKIQRRLALFWPILGFGACAVRKCCTINGGNAIDYSSVLSARANCLGGFVKILCNAYLETQ